MSEQCEPFVSRHVYKIVMKKYKIMPDILYALLCGRPDRWHFSLNDNQIMAVKMYLVAEFGEKSGDTIQTDQTIYDHNIIMYGWHMFTSWDSTTVGLSGYGGALLRHVTSPWKSPYARLTEVELEQTENDAFDKWCDGMGLY